MCITSITEQPILCKSVVYDIQPLVCLFVCYILFTNLVQRSCNRPAACIKRRSWGIASEETHMLLSCLCTAIPRRTPHEHSANYHHPPQTPITAWVRCTACMFGQQQNPITSSKGQWEQQGAEISRKRCSFAKLSFYGFKNLQSFIMPKSSEGLFSRMWLYSLAFI